MRFLFILILCSCGYSMGSMTPVGINTISIPTFKNKTLYRDYEFLLTDSVVKELATHSSLNVYNSKNADSILNGKILKISQSTVSKRNDLTSESFSVSVTVEIEWIDLRTGKFILPNKKLSKSVSVIIAAGQSFSEATSDALRKLAVEIVYNLQDRYLMGEAE